VHIPEEKRFEKLKILSVAELFGNAIKCTNKGQSISGLYFRY
jgi:ribose-phosphate pyrophosphokinase